VKRAPRGNIGTSPKAKKYKSYLRIKHNKKTYYGGSFTFLKKILALWKKCI
jgi:hypothetical protein